MDSHAVHPSSLALRKQQSGDSSAREPPPYPGHLQLWQQSGYSTSYSGSEASTDMSMSSLESLSTSARQEPQGEETVDIPSSMVDGCLVNIASSADILPSSVFGSQPDLKLLTSSGGCGDFARLTSNGFEKEASGSPPMTAQRLARATAGDLPKYPQSPVYAGNSLIRQLLQASPQYSHLLGDLVAPLNGMIGTTKPSALSGSPKLQHATTTATATTTTRNADVLRSQQTTSSSSVVVKKSGSISAGTPQLSRFHASNCRIVNGYVNICGDDVASDRLSSPAPSSASVVTSSSPPAVAMNGKTPVRDRSARPSTAPADHSQQQQQQFSSSASASLEQPQSDRRRSCEALDRTVSNGSEPTSSTHVVDCLVSGRGVVSGEAIGPTAAQRMHPICGPHQDQTPLSNSQLTSAGPEQRSSPRQVNCSQQRVSPQLRESPQQRNSPSQLLQKQYEESSNATVSCPLQSTGDQQHVPQQTVCAHAAIATRATQMVERLSEENRGLRQELKVYYKKVSRLEKVEHDIQKVSEAYETLSQHSQKRENLERLMRLKLESEISCLNDTNQQLQEQLERSLSRLQKKQGYNSPESELKKELRRKDSLITRLITQNRELLTAKLKLESDLVAQRSVASENRSRVEMLENVLAKEALDRRRLVRQQSVSSDHQISLHGNGEKCENGKAEDEFHVFKAQQCDTDDGISSDSESPTSIHSLIRQMQEKERQILRLEADVIKWEEKFLEETVFRQLAVDAISIPKDAKIAALVQNSADTDRLLADARLEKLALLKELHETNERCAQLEARIKSLQADLAEKDSLIHVLQRHPSLSRASSISSLLAASCSSPQHSPQQQHRSPPGTAVHGNVAAHCNGGASSKLSSGSSSRQGSQLSAGCASTLSSSLPKHSKLVGLNSTCMASDGQSVHKKMTLLDTKSAAGGVTSDYETDQLKQCFWQV